MGKNKQRSKSSLVIPKKENVVSEENTTQTKKELAAGAEASKAINHPENKPVISNTSGTDQIGETAGGTISPVPDEFPRAPTEKTDQEKLEEAEASRAANAAGETQIPTDFADNTPQNTAHTPATWIDTPEVGVPANAEIIRSPATFNPTEDNPLQAQIAVDCNVYTDTVPTGVVKQAKAGENVEIIGKEISRIQNNWYKVRWPEVEATDEKGKKIKKKESESLVGYLPVEYLANIK